MAKWVTSISWDDVPHLSKDKKEALYAAYMPHEREARSKGIPSIGSGKIYPFPEDDISCHPFRIPSDWPRAYGLDVGWNKTAAVWGALDETTDTIYIYHEYYCGQQLPLLHAQGINRLGSWIPGAIDPASNRGSERDGKRLFTEYKQIGLNLYLANNSVEAGLERCINAFGMGRVKIFTTCTNLFNEMRVYRRDEHGRVVRKNNHLMDAMRYLIMTGMSKACCKPDEDANSPLASQALRAWRDASKNDITGY